MILCVTFCRVMCRQSRNARERLDKVPLHCSKDAFKAMRLAERLDAERDAPPSASSPDLDDSHYDMLSSGFVHV